MHREAGHLLHPPLSSARLSAQRSKVAYAHEKPALFFSFTAATPLLVTSRFR